MKRGYWDRDGFHEGPMPAMNFFAVLEQAASADAGRYESGRPSGQVANSPQPVIGSPRGGCNSPDRASRRSPDEFVDDGQPIQLSDCHPARRDAAWVERELGDVSVRPFLDAPWHRPVAALASSTVGAIK